MKFRVKELYYSKERSSLYENNIGLIYLSNDSTFILTRVFIQYLLYYLSSGPIYKNRCLYISCC